MGIAWSRYLAQTAKAEQALFFPPITLVETHGWGRELVRYLAIAIGINDHLGLAVTHNKA